MSFPAWIVKLKFTKFMLKGYPVILLIKKSNAAIRRGPFSFAYFGKFIKFGFVAQSKVCHVAGLYTSTLNWPILTMMKSMRGQTELVYWFIYWFICHIIWLTVWYENFVVIFACSQSSVKTNLFFDQPLA